MIRNPKTFKFDKDKSCGMSFLEQVFADLNKRAIRKIKKNDAAFTYLALDSNTINPKCGYEGIYAKHINYFVCPRSEGGVQCKKIKRKGNEVCHSAVIYIDIVSFKAFNDTLSERMGDVIIAYFANYLKSISYGDFPCMVVRKGGDEFHIYIMATPLCEGKKTGKPSPPGEEDQYYRDIESVFQNKEHSDYLNGKKMVLHFPRNKDTECCAISFDHLKYDSEATDDVISIRKKEYEYRLVIGGMRFRCGVGKDEELACKNKERAVCDDKGNNIKPAKAKTRGEFNEEAVIYLYDIAKNENTDVKLCEHMLFIVEEKEETEYAEEIKQHLVKQGYTVAIYKDIDEIFASIRFIGVARNSESIKGEQYKYSDVALREISSSLAPLKDKMKIKTLSGVSVFEIAEENKEL